MLNSQDFLVQLIENELNDRIENETDDVELDGLRDLKDKVSKSENLSFPEYQWLCDLVTADQEMLRG